jgi:hypothetical protein
MKKLLGVLLLVLALSVLMSGCKSAPTEEINATKSAIESIETDDVHAYAPESLKAAQDEMNKALAEVKTQDEKFSLTRDYKQSVALLKSAKEMAEKASLEAQENKEKAKNDAETAIAELPLMLKEAKDQLAKAPKGKDTKADLEAMQNDLKLAEEAAAEARMSMSTEKYIDALTKASTAKTKATSILEQIKTARQKTGRKS